MTPEERAKKLVDEHFPDVQGESLIAAAIREAVTAADEKYAALVDRLVQIFIAADPEAKAELRKRLNDPATLDWTAFQISDPIGCAAQMFLDNLRSGT